MLCNKKQDDLNNQTFFIQKNKTGSKTGSKTGLELDENVMTQLDCLRKTEKTDKTGLLYSLHAGRDTHIYVCVYYVYIKDRISPVFPVLSVLRRFSSWDLANLQNYLTRLKPVLLPVLGLYPLLEVSR